MCEILFFARDVVNNDDADLNKECYKRGDVVAIVATDHQWSQAELTNPAWRILRLPNVTINQASTLLISQADRDQHVGPRRGLRRRDFRVGLNNVNWPQAVRNWFLDDTRAQPKFSSNLTGAQLLDFVEDKRVTG